MSMARGQYCQETLPEACPCGGQQENQAEPRLSVPVGVRLPARMQVPVLELCIRSLWVPSQGAMHMWPPGRRFPRVEAGPPTAWIWVLACLQVLSGPGPRYVCGRSSGHTGCPHPLCAVVEPGWPQTPALLCPDSRWSACWEETPPVSLEGRLAQDDSFVFIIEVMKDC